MHPDMVFTKKGDNQAFRESGDMQGAEQVQQESGRWGSEGHSQALASLGAGSCRLGRYAATHPLLGGV